MSFLCSTFASNCFLADCLHVIQFGRGCCSWSGYAMMLFLAVYSFYDMPSWWMYAYFIMRYSVVSASSSRRCLHNYFNAMLCLLKSVNETCYVYVGAIIFSVPFWLMVSKGLLLYALSRFMPCLVLLCSDPVACCYLALNIASRG